MTFSVRCANWSVPWLKRTAQYLFPGKPSRWHLSEFHHICLMKVTWQPGEESATAMVCIQCLSHLSLSARTDSTVFSIFFILKCACMHAHAQGNQSGMWFSKHYENENPHSKILEFFNILIFWNTDLMLVCTTCSFLFPTYHRIYSEMARQGKNVVFLFLIAPLAKGQTWQQQILFLSVARSVPFSLSNVNIHINVKYEYCSTKENNFLHHSVCSDTGRKIWIVQSGLVTTNIFQTLLTNECIITFMILSLTSLSSHLYLLSAVPGNHWCILNVQISKSLAHTVHTFSFIFYILS